MRDFDSPAACLDWLEHGLYKGMGYVEAHLDAERRKRMGQRQTLCGGCNRWKWPDEQCNHFTPRAEPAERKPRKQ